jgi:hypothetical protein
VSGSGNVQDSDQRTMGWHVAHWPPLAWLETIVKLAALGIGIAALAAALGGLEFALPAGPRLAQFVVLSVLSVGLIAAIADRIAEREIVAMGFVIINNVGHWGMLLSLMTPAGPGGLLVPFAGLMLVGDLVKVVFIRVHEFQVRDTPRSVLYGLTLFYVAGYAALLALEFLR